MMFIRSNVLSLIPMIAAILAWDHSAIAQDPMKQPSRTTGVPSTLATPDSVFVNATEYNEWVREGSHEGQRYISGRDNRGSDGKLFGGIDILLIRPHFSEAIAFASGLQTGTGIDITGQDIEFDYEGSFRLFAGYRYGSDSEIRFTYWHFRGDADNNGTAPGAGQFIADPFGNIVGTVTVIDPHSALFGVAIVGGAQISTRATVETNVYDLEYTRRVGSDGCKWDLNFSGGLRIADIDQYYESRIVNAGGAFFSGGDFSVDFIGVGPRVGFEFRRFYGECRQSSFFVKTNGSLLVGDYNITSSQTTTVPAFRATQTESLTKTIPVFETELGVSRQYNDSLNFTVGWLFQAWFDMGTSGGKFGGFFGGADDSNIMSFDGLFLRGEYAY